MKSAATSIRVKRCAEDPSEKPSSSDGGGNLIQSQLTDLNLSKLFDKINLKQIESIIQTPKSKPE